MCGERFFSFEYNQTKKQNKNVKGGFSALLMASYHGHDRIVDRLLECKDINVNIQDHDGWEHGNANTPLLVAIKNSNLDIVNRLLLREELDCNLENNVSCVFGCLY